MGFLLHGRYECQQVDKDCCAELLGIAGLSEYDATQLTQSKKVATYFESATQISCEAKLTANWVLGEVSAFINKKGIDIDDVEVPDPVALGYVIKKVVSGEINGNGAKTAFQEMCTRTHKGISDLADFVDQIIKDRDLKQMSDTGELEKIIDDVLAANPKNVEEFKAGNAKALNGLVGPIMKASKGKANPGQVNALLMKKLG